MEMPQQARPDDLEGEVPVITGADSRASGIGNGRAAAVLLAEAEMKVALVDSVTERGDGVDVLFNNVGIVGPSGSVVDVDLDAWDRCLDINVTSMVLMSRFCIPHMRRRGGGSIINNSSIAGVLGAHPSVFYSATEGAVTNLARAMAATHGPEAIVPGFLHTPMVYGQGLSEEDRVRRRNVAPLGQGGIEGSGWDVGELVRFLASDKARFISGANIPVDGGVTAVIPMTPSMSVTAPVDGS